MKRPCVDWLWAEGSQRTSGGCPPRRVARSSVMASMITLVASVRVALSSGRPAKALRSTGSPTTRREVFRGKSVDPFGIAREDLVRSPVRHRHHGDTAFERHPRGTGVALHRPQLGIPGQRALGVDDDGSALVHHFLGDLQRAVGARRRAFHRDLLGGAQHEPQHGHLEESGLGQEVRHPLLVVEHVPHNQGVDFGAVIGCCDEAAGGKLLQAEPFLPHQEVHDRPDNPGNNDKGDVALGRFLHVVPATRPR